MGKLKKIQNLHNVLSIVRIPAYYNQFDFTATKISNLYPHSPPLPHPPPEEKELQKKENGI
jgi:hypothetical protein